MTAHADVLTTRQAINHANAMANIRRGFSVTQDHSIVVVERQGHNNNWRDRPETPEIETIFNVRKNSKRLAIKEANNE